MSNLNFIINNITDNIGSAVVTIGSEASGHLVANVLTDKKAQTWRSTDLTAQQLQLTWTSVQTVGGMAIAFSNLVAGNKFRFRLYDSTSGGTLLFDTTQTTLAYNNRNPSGFTTIGASSFAFGGGTYCSAFTPNLTNVRRMLVDIPPGTNPDGYFEISRLIAGEAWTPDIDPNFGATFTNDDKSSNVTTSSGDIVVNRSSQSRKLSFTNQWLTVADAQNMSETMRMNGKHTPVFVSLLSNETNHLYQEGQIYGRFSESTISYSTYSNFSANVEINEF